MGNKRTLAAAKLLRKESEGISYVAICERFKIGSDKVRALTSGEISCGLEVKDQDIRRRIGEMLQRMEKVGLLKVSGKKTRSNIYELDRDALKEAMPLAFPPQRKFTPEREENVRQKYANADMRRKMRLIKKWVAKLGDKKAHNYIADVLGIDWHRVNRALKSDKLFTDDEEKDFVKSYKKLPKDEKAKFLYEECELFGHGAQSYFGRLLGIGHHAVHNKVRSYRKSMEE